jgi:hypothetical protein
MNTIKTTPDLLKQYAGMTKNEILLHMALRSLAAEGKLKRNVLAMCRVLSKTERRLRDAEYGLKKRGLLRIHLMRDQRWWYVYDTPINAASTPNPSLPAPLAQSTIQVDVQPKPRSLLRRFGNWLTGAQIDRFDLEVR